jgi:hypothetical protein
LAQIRRRDAEDRFVEGTAQNKSAASGRTSALIVPKLMLVEDQMRLEEGENVGEDSSLSAPI